METFSEPNDTLMTATPTGLSAPSDTVSFSGAIGDNPNVDAELDVDLFEVQLDEGDRLVADIEAAVVGSELDSVLRLFDASGNEVVVNDNFDNLDSLIDFTAPESDAYFIGVSGFDNFDYNPFEEGSGSFSDGSTGEYTLEIALGSAPPPLPALPSGFSQNIANLVDGTNGFILEGIDPDDQLGSSVSGAGDINGDGFDDLIIGAPGASPNGNDAAGESYVVLGSSRGLTENLNLAGLDGTNGFILEGIDANDFSGNSVSGAGDVNGDGFDDLIIGAFGAGNLIDGYYYSYTDRRGESYVVFGSSGFDASLNFADLNGINGFILEGADANDFSGNSVSGAGDVNGDGFDDLIIGAFDAGNLIDGYYFSYSDRRGESYVVFGSSRFDASLDFADLNGSNGFILNGINARDYLGSSVSGAGDVNGDGFDDLIIGAPGADTLNNGYYSYNTDRGESYVIFGSSQFEASLELAELDGTNGFVLRGVEDGDYLGSSVSGAGDVNGDGFDDLIIGAPFATNSMSGYYGSDEVNQGESYIIFGSSQFEASLELAELDETKGVSLSGIDFLDRSGRSVSGAGDINGDGFDDLIIGAPDAGNPGSRNYSIFDDDDTRGESYIILGSKEFESSLKLTELDGTNGFILRGIDPLDRSGSSVSGAVDINGDGLDDLIIGARNAGNQISGYEYNSNDSRGESYVIFGSISDRSLTGTENSDTLVDLEEVNLISALDGDDTVAGLAGDDEIFGGDGDDVLRGDLNSRSPGGTDGGDDTLFGGAGNDRLGGKGGNDLLLGGLNDDQLFGDDGDDVLVGSLGDDTLQGDDFSGGQGQDIFVLSSGEGTDTIVDFEVGTDFIELTDLSFINLSISGTEDASINFGDETLAIVQGVSSDNLNATSFVSI